MTEVRRWFMAGFARSNCWIVQVDFSPGGGFGGEPEGEVKAHEVAPLFSRLQRHDVDSGHRRLPGT